MERAQLPTGFEPPAGRRLSGGLELALGLLDLAASVIGDSYERGAGLVGSGDYARAVACLGKSDKHEAVMLLAHIIKIEGLDFKIYSSALSAIAEIAQRSPESRHAAINCLVSAVVSDSRSLVGQEAAKNLAVVMRSTEDIGVHGDVCLQLISISTLRIRLGDRLPYLQVDNEHMCRFCTVAAALRDERSAQLIAQAVTDATGTSVKYWLLAAANARKEGSPAVSHALMKLDQFVTEPKSENTLPLSFVPIGKVLGRAA